MPFGDPDLTDPTELVAVSLPAEAGTMTEMAYVFAEEFARMGYDAGRILRLFTDPFYAGAYRAYQALGRQAVSEIVEECVGVWGGPHGAPSGTAGEGA